MYHVCKIATLFPNPNSKYNFRNSKVIYKDKDKFYFDLSD